MEFPTLQPPSNIQRENPSCKYLNPSANKIPLERAPIEIISATFPTYKVKIFKNDPLN